MPRTIIGGLTFFCTGCGDADNLTVKTEAGQFVSGSCNTCGSTALESTL